MTIKISAIICTHNRAHLIYDTIDSLLQQNFSKNSYEIIVVDNASYDNTQNLIQERYGKAENLKYIFEKNLGLSYARNTGWQNANGQFVAFIDDDALAKEDWLSEIIEAFTNNPDAGIVGGKVDPIWSKTPPQWIQHELLHALSLVDWSNEPIFLGPDKWLAGVNVAYRRKLLEKFGGFNTDLGRKGKKLISNEEIFLNNKILKEGFKIYYSPTIYVRHFIPEERLKKEWFLSRYYWQGRSDAVMDWGRFSGNHKKLKKEILKHMRYILTQNLFKIYLFEKGMRNRIFIKRRFGYLVGILLLMFK